MKNIFVVSLFLLSSASAFASFEGPLAVTSDDSVEDVIGDYASAYRCSNSDEGDRIILIKGDERDAFLEYVRSASYLYFNRKNGKTIVEIAGTQTNVTCSKL